MTKLQKTKARLERAKLVVVAARERAAEMTQQSAERYLTMRSTMLQRRRLRRFSARS
jgi:ABC-type transporter lipoprotein component MlaA